MPTATTFTGRVLGGQQPVNGAAIQLYAVATNADGAPSTPLLTKELSGQATLRAILYFTNVTVAGVGYDEMEFQMNNVYVTGFSTSSGGDVPFARKQTVRPIWSRKSSSAVS